MTESSGRYDVVIVGGGAVGLAAALSLAGAVEGVAIAVLDRRKFAPPADARASAIAPAVRRALDAMQMWSRLQPFAEPILSMQVTDSGIEDIARPGLLQFGSEWASGEPIAHMVPNTDLVRELLAALDGRAEFLAPVEIVGLDASGGLCHLALADGRQLRAPLVIAADGARSALRGMAGIETFEHDYRQSGIVATIAHELDHRGVAYEHFRPAGPFASLPLQGRRSSLVWTEAADTAARYKDMPHQELAMLIEAAMGSTLGAVTLESGVQVFPLHLTLARRFVARRLALVGDAAHVIHPLAGQGLNLGLKDVAALAEVVTESLRLGLDHGSPEVLARYENWRRPDAAVMAGLTDGLNRLFSKDNTALRALRDFGLTAVDRLPLVKHGLIAAAAGGLGRGNPKLLEGRQI